MKFFRRSTQIGSTSTLTTQKRNFRNVQIDAIGVGLASAASPFLPVFLTRLGASNFQVGLLTSMPAFTGLFLALVIGSFLQRRRNVVPWFSTARLLVISCYAMTGIAPFLVPRELAVQTVLLIWAVATLPQTIVAVCFSVVMNAVAGPEGRYDLMSRRWSILGLTTSITVAVVGKVLDTINFPINYQIVFIGLSMGGLISFYFSSHIALQDVELPVRVKGESIGGRLRSYSKLIRSQPAFSSFATRRFVYLTGSALAAPLFPLYFVRVIQASDYWIGLINTAQSAVLFVAYFFWVAQSRRRGSRFVLLATTLFLSLYPALTAVTHQVQWIVVYAGIAGIFQAGLELVFFDELMKTVPAEYSATFVSLAQSLQYFSALAAPLVGTWLADRIGISGGLIISASVRLLGFIMFALAKRAPVTTPQSPSSSNPSPDHSA